MRATALLITLLAGSACFAEETAQSLVEGAAARYGALKSGKLTYLFESWNKRKGPDGKELDFKPEKYSFSGKDWAMRWPVGDNVTGSFRGTHFAYAVSPDRSRISLRSEHPPEVRALNNPPVFAGSFWYEEQPEFVKQRSKSFQLVGNRNIDGVETKICEIVLPKELARKGFIRWPSLREGGTLRLYIAPQLGYVLPLIECVDFLNRVQYSYEESSFSEVAPNLWLPGSMKCGLRQQDPNLPLRYCGFTWIKYESVNQPIPEEEFIVKLSAGTRVDDHRGDRRTGYQLDKECTTADLIPEPK